LGRQSIYTQAHQQGQYGILRPFGLWGDRKLFLAAIYGQSGQMPRRDIRAIHLQLPEFKGMANYNYLHTYERLGWNPLDVSFPKGQVQMAWRRVSSSL